MANIVNFAANHSRCEGCRFRSDCPMLDEKGHVGSDISRRVRIFHRGDQIFCEGTTVNAIYRVRSGVVKTTLTDAAGREQVTGFVGPGEWIGLDSLDATSYFNTATTLDTTSVCVVPQSALRALAAHAPRGMMMLLSALARRINAQDALHMSLARDSAIERMASFLLDLSNRQKQVSLNADEIALTMSRSDIASYLALAVETVSRLLTTMHREGVIEVNRSRVTILNRNALMAAAGPVMFDEQLSPTMKRAQRTPSH